MFPGHISAREMDSHLDISPEDSPLTAQAHEGQMDGAIEKSALVSMLQRLKAFPVEVNHRLIPFH